MIFIPLGWAGTLSWWNSETDSFDEYPTTVRCPERCRTSTKELHAIAELNYREDLGELTQSHALCSGALLDSELTLLFPLNEK